MSRACRIFYQQTSERLKCCVSQFHIWLHIVDYIERAGPCGCFWCWVCERACGRLARAISSRKYPYASLNRRALEEQSLQAIINTYDLQAALPVYSQMHNMGENARFTSPDYPHLTLLHPRQVVFFDVARIKPLKQRIANHLSRQLGVPAAVIKPFIGISFEQFGRVHMANSDQITSRVSTASTQENRRDSTFIEYVVHMGANNTPDIRFGQLERAFVVHLPASPRLRLAEPTSCILLDVRRCRTKKDTNGFYDYKYWGAFEVLSGHSLRNVVGRIRDRNRWTFVRRTGGLRHAHNDHADVA